MVGIKRLIPTATARKNLLEILLKNTWQIKLNML